MLTSLIMLEQDDMGTDNNDNKWTNTKMDALPSIQILSYHHNHNRYLMISCPCFLLESSFLLATDTTVNVSQEDFPMVLQISKKIIIGQLSLECLEVT